MNKCIKTFFVIVIAHFLAINHGYVLFPSLTISEQGGEKIIFVQECLQAVSQEVQTRPASAPNEISLDNEEETIFYGDDLSIKIYSLQEFLPLNSPLKAFKYTPQQFTSDY